MAIFKTIHTLYGLRCLAAAEASNTPIVLTHIAVGDGNGNAVEPKDTQEVLVRERFRNAVNRVYQDSETPTKFIAELIIPAAIGGFTLREFGVFDDTGSLFVVGNLPDTYKPVPTDGAFSDTVLRVEFYVQNAAVVTVQVDPHIAVATQHWVINNITTALMIPGGTTGQLLRKVSNADGDTEWGDPTDVHVTVDTIEETQTLAEDQTVVDLAVTTTRGVAIYIEGERLRRDQWEPDPLVPTRLTLGTTYPAGTKLIAAQNEPTGNAPAPLERSKNLSDVEDVPTARSNLGIYSKDETDQNAPAGQIGHTARSTAPVGWLKANGAAVSRIAFARLFAAIGTIYGAGDGFNTFNLPDLRGRFVRSWDDGRGLDPGRALGSAQGSQNQSHGHGVTISYALDHLHGQPSGVDGGFLFGGNNGVGNNGTAQGVPPGGAGFGNKMSHVYTTGPGGGHGHSATVSNSGGDESRPTNIALLGLIRY